MRHYEDVELLAAADGECSPAERESIRAHLENCWECRARMVELEKSIADVMAVSPAPVKARRGLWLVPALVLIALAIFWFSPTPPSPLPRTDLTPGAAKSFRAEDVCALRVEDIDRAVPGELARLTFARYGMNEPRAGEYEVDYLISPSLGGARDVRNLWPQPYQRGEWNAHVKDALEDFLRREVCSGRIALETAQSEISTDWIAAYRKYFRARKPIAAHAMFVKDEPY
jgi:hypothetical protein